MKYLKKFNESFDEDDDNMDKYLEYLDEDYLHSAIDNHLSFLIDDGFQFEFEENYDGDAYINMTKEVDDDEVNFDYSEIDDTFSPFLELLSEKYDSLAVSMSISENENRNVSIDSLISGEISPNNIEYISLYIYQKDSY